MLRDPGRAWRALARCSASRPDSTILGRPALVTGHGELLGQQPPAFASGRYRAGTGQVPARGATRDRGRGAVRGAAGPGGGVRARPRHRGASPRVQARRGLVQEDDLQVADQAGRQVQSAPHAGVRLRRPAARAGQLKAFQQSGRLAAGVRPAAPEQAADHDQVLLAGQLVIHRGVLPGQGDQLTDLNRIGDHVVTADPGLPGVRLEQGGEQPHRGRLPGAVRAEQGQDGTALGREPGAHQGPGPAEALLQAFGLDHAAHPASLVALMVWLMSTASRPPLTGPCQHADR